MGSELLPQQFLSGSMPAAARKWVEATDSLIDNAGPRDKRQWSKIQFCGYWHLQAARKRYSKRWHSKRQPFRLPPTLR